MCDEPEYIFYQTIDKKHCSTPKMEWTFNVSFYFVSMSYRHRDMSIFGWAKSMSSTWISITRFILHIILFHFSWYVCWLYILSCLNCRLSVLKCLYKVELKSFSCSISSKNNNDARFYLLWNMFLYRSRCCWFDKSVFRSSMCAALVFGAMIDEKIKDSNCIGNVDKTSDNNENWLVRTQHNS